MNCYITVCSIALFRSNIKYLFVLNLDSIVTLCDIATKNNYDVDGLKRPVESTKNSLLQFLK